MGTVRLMAVLELPVLNGERRGDRYRLADGRGLDPIEEPLTSTQDLLELRYIDNCTPSRAVSSKDDQC